MNTERQERHTALDQFATMASTPREESGQRMPMTTGGELTHGAIAVAIHRDEAKVLEKLKVLAAAAGSEWFYRFPVKNRKENRTDWIEGPSIKLANDLARIYGNNETDCRAVDAGDNWMFYARFIDLETGFSMTRPFQQRKSGAKIGGGDQERANDIAMQIGASKAIRNVIVNSLQTFADFAFEEAKNALVDRIGKDLANYRVRTADRVTQHVKIERVEAVVGRAVRDWLAPDVARVIAMMKAVSDGFATIDESFPPLDRGGTTDSNTTSALDRFAGEQGDSGDTGTDQSDHSESQTPRDESGSGEDDAGAGGTESPTLSPAQIIDTLRDRLAQANDDETIQEIWDQLDIDGKFMADKIMLDRAKKVLGARKKELRP